MAHEDNQVNPQFVQELIYQPLELITEYKTEVIHNVTYHKLQSVSGMRPYKPDTKIKDSCLLDMLKKSGEIEFLMVVTMYNEDKVNFTDTMHGIVHNLKKFQEDGLDPSLIGCIIIVDGIRPFSSTFRKPDQNPYFSNFFNEQMIKDRFGIEDTINGIPLGENQEIAHCFSFNTNFGLEGFPDLQTVFCVKQKNKRKLNTHLWFFGGFCEMINPKFVMLIDVGTKPFGQSLCALYDAMKTNPLIGGVCGEIAPMDPQYANIVVSGQTVEYTFSHIFDKALESCFGYIGVLPGAFSAYRWEALQNGPLIDDYFKTMTMPEIMNAYYSNIFLAEDRVLSLAIVSKPGTQYLLKFVPPAYAETDVPEKLFVLLSQRRRWINGSWFALIETWLNFGRIKNSAHTRWRKFWMTMELLYFTVTIMVSWVMVGSFYLFSELIFEGLAKVYSMPNLGFMTVPEAIMSVYIALLLLVFMMSLGVKTSRVEGTYRCISILFGFYMLIGFIILNFFTFSNAPALNAYSVFLLVATIGSYTIGIVITKNVKKVVFRTVQLLAITPIYVNLFGIYSVCNIHDCSWGNRPEVMTEEEIMKQDEFQHYRTKWVIWWIISNMLYVKFMETLIAVDPKMTVLTVLFTVAVILILCRFIGCIWHYTNWYFDNKDGAKRYIRLSPADDTAKAQTQLLNKIASSVNKSQIGSKSMLRKSILGALEKSTLRRGNTIHQNLTRMVKQSEMYDSSEEEDEDYDSEEYEVGNTTKRLRRAKTKNETFFNKKSGLKDATFVQKRVEDNLELIANEASVEARTKENDEIGVLDFGDTGNNGPISAKNQLEDEFSIIQKNEDENGVLDFKIDEDFNPNRDQLDNFKQDKELDFTKEGILNFDQSSHEKSQTSAKDHLEGSLQDNFVWDAPEDGSEEMSSSSNESEDTEEMNRYMKMLPSIIKSVSESEDEIN